MLGVILFVLLAQTALSQLPLCEEDERVVLPTSEESIIEAHGLNFTNGTFWQDESGIFFGCPCEIKPCLRHCGAKDSEYAWPDDLFELNLSTPLDDDESIWKHDLHILKYHFFLLNRSESCSFHTELPNAFVTNGGQLAVRLQDSPDELLSHPGKFCIFAENKTLKGWICGEVPQGIGLRTILTVVLSSISIFFLLLVLVAFCLVSEMRNLQGKSIACQSATLAIGLLGLSVTHSTGNESHFYVCVMFAYIMYYFTLTSFFWLNSMCFDICWTFSNFKQMASFTRRSHSSKFSWYAFYSTACPMVLFFVLVILDTNLDENSEMWPGIGAQHCWFYNRTSEFWFFQGPLVTISLSNAIFFMVTLFRIYKFKRASKTLGRGDSKRHMKQKEDNQNLMLALKLFALMGGTWFMEFVSWCSEGDHVVWIIFDMINILRGPFYFYFCVVGNTKVRESLLRRFLPKLSTQKDSNVDTQGSAISESNPAVGLVDMKFKEDGSEAGDGSSDND